MNRLYQSIEKYSIVLITCLLAMEISAQNWTKVGTGTNATVSVLKPIDEGLIIGGEFTQLNGFERVHLAFIREEPGAMFSYFTRYNDDFNSNSTNTALAGSCIKAAESYSGQLHVAGRFYHPTEPDRLSAGYFQVNDTTGNSTFFAYGSSPSDKETVFCMRAFEGKLYLGGDFKNWNGAQGIARLESAGQMAPEPAAFSAALVGSVHCFEVFNNELYAGGHFITNDTDSVVNIARWNGSAWEALGNGLNGPVYAMTVFNNQLVAAGAFTHSDTIEMPRIAIWNDSTWNLVGAGFTDSLDTVFALAVYDDTLYAGGLINASESIELNNLARLDGSSWFKFSLGTNGAVRSMTTYRNRLYIGGDFTAAESTVCRYIIAYNYKQKGLGLEGVKNPSFSVFPNPASDRVQIKTTDQGGVMNVRITDQKAQLVLTQKLSEENETIDLSSIAKGMYFLEIEFSNGQHETTKLIIQ